VSTELAVAIIAAIVSLVSAGVTLYGQVRTARHQAQAATELEDLKLVQRQYADINAFCMQQGAALTEAYLMLFEHHGALEGDCRAIGRLAAKADGVLMAPLRNYETLIDEETRNKIYAVHNVVAQLRGNPGPGTVTNFKGFKNEFYVLVNGAKAMLNPNDLLVRAQVIKERDR
jgi:dihydroxyacetone kinase